MCFLCRLASETVRIRHVLALVPMVACVVLADQRAVLVNLAVVVSVVLVVLVVTYRHGIARRLHVGLGQLALTLLAVVAVAMVIVVAPSAVDQQPARIPLASTFQGLFHSEAKVESAQDRLNLAASVESMIPQHLLIGWGLGVEFQYYETGTRTELTIPYAHNIVLDLWLRLGLIGLVLFVVALAASLIGGLQVWRRHPEPMTAALALALVAVLAGLMATALLEPLLDEYRFATLLGVSIGMLRAAVTSMGQGPRLPSWRLEATHLKAVAGGVKWT
jgi:O-antigen ligase